MAKEVTITFLNSSVQRRPPPSTSNGAPNQTIIPDRISMKILLEIYLAIGTSPLHFEIIHRGQTSANVQGYNNFRIILLTTDRIFAQFLSEINLEPRKFPIIFWKSSMECVPPPNTSSGAPDQTKTDDLILMKILPEMYIGIRKSSLQFGIHP